MSLFFKTGALPLALLISLSLTGCSAEAKKERAVKRADTYAASGEYEKAKIDYLNALKEDPKDAAVLQKLGDIWLKQGAPMEAYRFFGAGLKLSPQDQALRLKTAQALATLGQAPQARTEALAILDASPGSGPALRILADTSRTPEEVAEAEQRLAKFPDREAADFHLATGTMALRRRDLPAAEAAIQRALAADPKSADAHSLKAAYHLFQGKQEEANNEIKTAAELSPARSPERVNYASIKAQGGDLAEAKRIAEEITKEAPDYVPALRVQAQIAYTEKKFDEAQKLLDKALATHPDNFESRLLQAEIWLAQGETKKAVEALERVAEKFPAPIAQYQLARAYLQDKNVERATAVLSQAIAANHDFAEAILLLAQLDLRAGDASAVVTAMEDLLKKRPNLPQAKLLLVDGYRALGRFDDATAILQQQIKETPNSSQAHLLLGVLYRQQGKVAEARETLEKALELAPDNLPVINQLVEMDLAEKKFTEAGEMIQGQLKKSPETAGLHFLQGKVHTAQQQWDAAEAALQKTLELDPNFAGAYDLLISIYVNTKKLPQALEQLGNVLEKNPTNPRVLMLMALIHEQQGEVPKAKEAYEKLLAAAPENAVAHNNLAYIYAERLNNPEKAFEHASKARSAKPEDASIADTLGWVQYKRGNFQQAQALLRESAGKLPDNAEVQYHLGMATYMMGQVEAAKAALEKAVNAPGDFAWKADAQKQLALLAAGGEADLPVAQLEAMVKQQPNDPLAHLRLAEAQEKAGAFAKAAASNEAALKLNPKLPQPYTNLAQLYAGPLKDQEKGFDFAKKARALAPNDPKIAGILGGVALQAGNAAWAYNVLQESARQLPKDATILRNLAWATYRIGKVSEAEETMAKIPTLAPESPEAAEAKTFVALTALEKKPEELAAAAPQIEEALKQNPKHTPALMAKGALQAQTGDQKAAIGTYTQVLKELPDFAPAQKQLAALYAGDPKNTEKALDLANKARRSLPEDPQLARTLGQLRYQRKEYKPAIQMLEESAKKTPLDAKSLHHLGISYIQSEQAEKGAKTLEQALAAGLQEPFAKEARQALAGLQQE